MMPDMTSFDRDLIRKYDRPGPRYTSYPTAPHMSDAFGVVDLEAAIERSNAGTRPLSLYVHLPFCRSLCLFCACNVVITSRRDRIADYLDVLEREVAALSARIDASRPVVQLHWGGGTPSYLTPDEIARVGEMLASGFTFADDIEASVELDPREVDLERVRAFRRAGFSRVSMGIQDLDPAVQEVINRIQPIEMTQRVVDWCRDEGFRSVNVDIMYGLPHQTLKSYETTIDAVLGLAPNRFAVFNYAHVPWLKKHQTALSTDDMPTPDEKLAILEHVTGRLTDEGYQFIGMDHFARPDDELALALAEKTLWRNFQGYTTRAGTDLFGLGVTSIGLLKDVYYQNDRGLKGYAARLEEGTLPVMRGLVLDAGDRLHRHVIMDLMCHFELDVAAIESRYAIDFWGHFSGASEEMEALRADGLVELTDGQIGVTEQGRFLIRNIAMVFDAYLDPERDRYSRTV
jgi:oxygen-independent coproporphyrinogen-3 oxidase